MDSHRRRLPHRYPAGTPLFITFHLYGSLPHGLYPPATASNAGQAFAWMDRYLDTARTGPLFLRMPEIARLIVEAIERGPVLGHYHLHSFVVMANHVHLLVTPIEPPSRFLHSLKGFTAREANRILGRTGVPFWQGESYDRWVRSPDEFERIRAYIEKNPVKAGIAAIPSDHPWSSASGAGTRACRAGS
jgi:putative DNA methylase